MIYKIKKCEIIIALFYGFITESRELHMDI